jgi:hypothetical protein
MRIDVLTRYEGRLHPPSTYCTYYVVPTHFSVALLRYCVSPVNKFFLHER